MKIMNEILHNNKAHRVLIKGSQGDHSGMFYGYRNDAKLVESDWFLQGSEDMKSYRSSHCLYLALLAFFDVFIAGAYIPLMSLNLLVDYWKSVVLLRAWFTYMIPMITVSHIAMTASSFLMVAASFERYCVTGYNQTVMTPIGTLDELNREEAENRGSPVEEDEDSSPPPAYPGLLFRFGTGLIADQSESDNNCSIIKNDMCL
ncbi:hypothetical protein OESDEN_05762 [Oesophagostomum dentatum]|uniref:Uncharacterized protein n=1 Tax=Oesophagostomum dentatum TaxID=61180 RepID=A0A0B1T9S2_OESDE|nr:hypothetical protein OESDEN_05762 [Oesophagostomum dentatum]